jgi:hypothetical protein
MAVWVMWSGLGSEVGSALWKWTFLFLVGLAWRLSLLSTIVDRITYHIGGQIGHGRTKIHIMLEDKLDIKGPILQRGGGHIK